MNIFNSLKTYAGKWNPVAEEAFDQASIDAVSRAEVVESQYGYSVAFYLKPEKITAKGGITPGYYLLVFWVSS